MKRMIAQMIGFWLIFGCANAQELSPRLKQSEPAPTHGRPGLSKADNARATMADYAECLVKMRHKQSVAFLSYMPQSPAAADAAFKLHFDMCLSNGTLVVPHVVLRGNIYRALYRNEFKDRNVEIREEPIDLAKDEGFTSPAYVALRQFGECVVRADTGDSVNIVVSAIGSEAEKTAFKNLSTHYSPCLQQGLEIEFSKSVMAGLIAEVLYRLSAPAT